MRTRGDRIFEIVCIVAFVAPIGGGVLGYFLSLPIMFVISFLPVEFGPRLATVLLAFQGMASVVAGVWLAWYVWPKARNAKPENKNQSNKPLQRTACGRR